MPVSAPERPASSGPHRRSVPSVTTADDVALVARAARGDERAFELLFQRHRTDLLAYATRMLRDHGRAEDVVQDVFVSAMRAIVGAAPEAQPVHVRAWLREIARRACIDQWRRAARRGEVSLDAPEGLLAGDARRLADEDSLARATDDRAAMATLRRAFDDLPELQHAVLVQRELEGRPVPEIADRLGLSTTVVEGQLARGRRALGQAYRELASGERCVAVRALCDASVDGGLGVRDRHRVGRHVQGCDACRRYARLSGVDARLVDRTTLSRASLLLPLPLLRRLPFEHAIASEAAGGVLGAKVLVGAAVVAAGSGGMYAANVAPLTAPAPREAAAGPRSATTAALVAGPDGRPVLRLPATDGLLPTAVLPAGGPLGRARATNPFLPPWLAAGSQAAPADRATAEDAARDPAPEPSAATPAPAPASAPAPDAAGPARTAGPAAAPSTPAAPVRGAAPVPPSPAPSGSGATDDERVTAPDDAPGAAENAPGGPSGDEPASVETPAPADGPASAEPPSEAAPAPADPAPADPAPAEPAPADPAPAEPQAVDPAPVEPPAAAETPAAEPAPVVAEAPAASEAEPVAAAQPAAEDGTPVGGAPGGE